MINKFKKGFTLIELLVVIGILAVLAAGIVALIDPVQKNKQAQDTKVKSDISQIVTAFQAFAAQDPSGNFPTAAGWQTEIVTTGQLTVVPTAPTGSAYTVTGGGAAATTVCGTLLSKKALTDAGTVAAPAAAAFFKWDSGNGKLCVRVSCATPCP